jgi:hypothetical protein
MVHMIIAQMKSKKEKAEISRHQRKEKLEVML